MKGVVLAGGLGTRLYPLTKITNKHLLPIYDRPMIHYPLESLVKAGIEDIMVVCGGRHAGEFLRLLGNGKEFGLKHLNYAYQEEERGIADALSLAESFVNQDKVIVFLADNFIQNDLARYVAQFEKQSKGAQILLKAVDNPRDYGVAILDEKDEIKNIIEKPLETLSNLAVVGIYFYDHMVFDFIKKLEPSDRNELEVSDLNMLYLKESVLKYDIIDGWWADAGASIEAYNQTCQYVYNLKR